MLRWLLISADKITVTDKFCVHRYPKTILWISEVFLDTKRVALISDRKFHKTASRPVLSKINPTYTKHRLLQGTHILLYQFDLCVFVTHRLQEFHWVVAYLNC
jgi:hypothetical protein